MYLYLIVIVAGLCTLGVEMAALTFFAPYFGTTQVVWACVIGSTLLYLSVGYLVGGRAADRWPETRILCRLLGTAAFWLNALPLTAKPILLWSLRSNSYPTMGLALAAVLLLFSVPMILMATASPFVIKLAINEVDEAGRKAGVIYALSTFGSLLGSFVPTLLLTPLIGITKTFYFFALSLSLASIAGLRGSRWITVPLLAAVAALALLAMPSSSIRPIASGFSYETQSFYNYIQVASSGDRVALYLNASRAMHSLYNARYEKTKDPRDLLVHSYWDYVPITPFLYPDVREADIDSLAVAGLGAGSVCKLFLALYGANSKVRAAEIDPEIIRVARAFFALSDSSTEHPNFQVQVQDGRVFLNHLEGTYDIILIDCFRLPYIPSHLVTLESFSEVRKHLKPRGVLVVKCDRSIIGQQITSTMRSAFPQVFQLVGMSIAVNQKVGDGLENMSRNAQHCSPVLRGIIEEALKTRTEGHWLFREWTEVNTILVDDRAPLEFEVHRSALKKFLSKGFER